MPIDQNLVIYVLGGRRTGKTSFVEAIDPYFAFKRMFVSRSNDKGLSQRPIQDLGFYDLSNDLILELAGLHPDSSMLDHVRNIESSTEGFCLLIDSTNPCSIYEGQAILKYLTLLDPVPYIIIANKQDREDAMTIGQIRREMDLSAETIILPCVATERASVANVLNTLLLMIRPDLQERIT